MIWDAVAPLAGAWIEITLNYPNHKRLPVAPLAGAWIEIIVNAFCFDTITVAPLAGAWIEIKCMRDVLKSIGCRSPRGSVD